MALKLDLRVEEAEAPGIAMQVHQRSEAFVEGRAGLVACFLAALGAYGVESLAWPIFHGRDTAQYIYYYVDFFHERAAFPAMMLYRTPVSPLFFGPLLQFTGAAGTEIAMGVVFALSVTAVAAAARTFSPWAAVATAAALILYPGYGALFHQVSSDAAFAGLFAFWLWRIAKTGRNPTVRSFAVHGCLVTLVVLARPAGQVFLLFALFPFLVFDRWRERLLGVGVFLGVSLALLGGWALHNHVRYDDFTVSRTSGAQVPMYRVFIVDRIAGPNYGPASQELARAVQQHLLTTQPYRAYGVTLQEFYSSGSSRMWEDLINLSDRVWGWDSNYSRIRAAAIEAVRAHPRLFTENVLRSAVTVLRASYDVPAVARSSPSSGPPAPQETIVVDGRRLPKPTEGQPIPIAHESWTISTPDRRLWVDWSSIENPVLRFRYAADARHAEQVYRERDRLYALYPNRDGNRTVARFLNAADRHYPSMWLWLIVGVLALALRRPARSRVVAVMATLALVLIVGSATGVPPLVEYRLPVDPAFILLPLVALLGASAPRPGHEMSRYSPTRRGRAMESNKDLR